MTAQDDKFAKLAKASKAKRAKRGADMDKIEADIGRANTVAALKPVLLALVRAHPDYRPHLTIAYVHKDRERDAIDAVRRALGTRDIFTHAKLEPIGLNYGRHPV